MSAIFPSWPAASVAVFRPATETSGGQSLAGSAILLGRCDYCRHPLRVSDAERGWVQVPQAFTAVYRVGEVVGLAAGGSHSRGMLVNCPACAAAGKLDPIGNPRRILLAPVLGRFNDAKKCDGRCTSATGHNCECQCGGRNHGSDHG